MIDLNSYRLLLRGGNGRAKKVQSDLIMNMTWNDDIQSRTAYIYDYFHDGEPLKLTDLHPENDELKTAVDIKFIITSYGTISKDQVEYHIMFRPNSKCPLDYYKEAFGKYSAEYPIGLYIDIPDDEGVYRRWLICNKEIGNAFVKYSVLPCNYIFNWVANDKKWRMCGVSRLRNSYNSGQWTDRIYTFPENQDQIWLPMNSISQWLFYDMRIIIDSRRDKDVTPQLTWHISKVENTHKYGINQITVAQDVFNPVTDLWDDDDRCWYADADKQKYSNQSSISGEITYSGVSPDLKQFASWKTFNVKFVDQATGTEIKNPKPIWKILDENGNAVPDSAILIQDVSDVSKKIKFVGNTDWFGKSVAINCTYQNATVNIKSVLLSL